MDNGTMVDEQRHDGKCDRAGDANTVLSVLYTGGQVGP